MSTLKKINKKKKTRQIIASIISAILIVAMVLPLILCF